MKNQPHHGKSKLYCNRCGSFDLTKLNRTFIARYIFNEPRKLHCQCCDAKLSFQQIALNKSQRRPSFYAGSDDTVLSNNRQGRPVYVTVDDYVTSGTKGAGLEKKHWYPFWTGVAGGLALFGIIVSVFIMSPYSKAQNITITKAVYENPIMRLGDVELLRLDNTKSKNEDIELALLDEPKKAPVELIWEDVSSRVTQLSRAPKRNVNKVLKKKASARVSKAVNTIQQDLDRLLSN